MNTPSAASNRVIEDGTLMTYTIPAPPPQAVLTESSVTVTTIQRSGHLVQIGSQVLVSGGDPMVLSDHTISAATSVIVEDVTTVALSLPASSTMELQALLTIGSSVIPAFRASASDTGMGVVGDKALSWGSFAIVSDGHSISAALEGLLYDGHTVGFSTIVSTI